MAAASALGELDRHKQDRWPWNFRGRDWEKRPYRFTIDDIDAMRRIGVLGGKGGEFELIDGIMLMRTSDVPIRLHSSDLKALYAADIIPAEVKTEMIEGVIYHVD